MLKLATRSAGIEAYITTHEYGLKLVCDFSQAILLARKSGKKSLKFSYDPDSIADYGHVHAAFVEYVKIKKYRIKAQNNKEIVVYTF